MPRALQITITTRTLLIAALVVFLGWAVVTVRDAILVVFLGIFIGLVLDAPTRLLMRHTRLGRGLAATVVVLGAIALVTLLAAWLLAPAVEAVGDFLHDLPTVVEGLRDSDELSSVGDTAAANEAQQGAQKIADAVPQTVSAILGLAGRAASAALMLFTLTFVALFFICDAPRLQAALASILPRADSERVVVLWERCTRIISRWAVGAAAIAVIAGTTQGVTAWLLGSSYALALGLIAGFLDLIPNIGATIAGFVLSLVLLAEEGVTAALIMGAVVIVYQQVENNLLTPTIQGKATNISGFFVIVSVTIFGALLGVLGALIAVPVTASIQLIVQEYTRDRRERLAAERAVLPPDEPASAVVT